VKASLKQTKQQQKTENPQNKKEAREGVTDTGGKVAVRQLLEVGIMVTQPQAWERPGPVSPWSLQEPTLPAPLFHTFFQNQESKGSLF
jgi:hypothetical protein